MCASGHIARDLGHPPTARPEPPDAVDVQLNTGAVGCAKNLHGRRYSRELPACAGSASHLPSSAIPPLRRSRPVSNSAEGARTIAPPATGRILRRAHRLVWALAYISFGEAGGAMAKRRGEHPSTASRWSLSSRCTGDRVRSHYLSKTRPAIHSVVNNVASVCYTDGISVVDWRFRHEETGSQRR